MTTAEYWRDRAEMVMEKGMARADVVLRDLQKMYAQAAGTLPKNGAVVKSIVSTGHRLCLRRGDLRCADRL